MKTKKILLLAALSALSVTAAMAQNSADRDTLIVHDDRTGRDETIDLPEGMTEDTDLLLQEWQARNFLHGGTDDTENAEAVFTSDDYRAALERLPAVMELPYNNVVQRFIDRYAAGLRRSVSFMLGAANFYMPVFEDALDARSLPLELRYLPVIESGLNPKAKSRVGAMGLWQFMIGTGRQYGLEVTSLVDERCDPYKASHAAAAYLSDLYKRYGDWSLVIAAYNCGPGNVDKAIARAGGSKDYWTIYPYLPAETRGYVPAFIAANYIMNYYCRHGISPMQTEHPVTCDTIMVSQNLHMEQIAELTGIEIEALRALNPQYRTDVIPGAQRLSSLSLPTDYLQKFLELGETVYAHRADELFTRRATVEVTEPDKSAPAARNNVSRNRKTSTARPKTVTIRSGETLSEIARRNGTTVDKLRRLNGIKGSNIRAGKKLRVR
ncbi:MAG: transglycosylase SLT domain-containing protein [Prevotellaceae bacterium]|nr:transglycosylase SLT domain-containing protein [Prevotellaceae bacterium]